jgi:CRP-like cAMP-binding protein
VLKHISLLGGLTDKHVKILFPLLYEVHYEAGERIFDQGDQPSYIYMIHKGRVKIVLDREEPTLELIELEEGQCFGETSIIGIQPHTASALSTEDTVLIVLSREVLFSLFRKDQELFAMLMLNIAREACRRLYDTDAILYHYVHGQKSVS